MNIWLQRLTIKIDPAISYSGKLCEKVIDRDLAVWNSDWLNVKFKKIIEETEIIKNESIEKMEIIFSKTEIMELGEYDKLFS